MSPPPSDGVDAGSRRKAAHGISQAKTCMLRSIAFLFELRNTFSYEAAFSRRLPGLFGTAPPPAEVWEFQKIFYENQCMIFIGLGVVTLRNI
jgi:hypothetical protein